MLTPSAAQGALESIFWKPEFKYEVRQIDVVKRGRSAMIRRNELKSRHNEPVDMSDSDVRTQRASLVLLDVAYVIHADIMLTERATDPVEKYVAQFQRRVERGERFQQPFFGIREFAAWFRPVPDDLELDEGFTLAIGQMPVGKAFIEDPKRAHFKFKRHRPDGKAEIVSGYAESVFFNALVEGGRLTVPPESYARIRELEAKHAA